MPIGRFPVPSHAHGCEIITVVVGKDEEAQTSTIHKSLLSLASRHFYGALNDGFKESFCSLALTEDCPFAFEALYQWLYSGKVMGHASWYTEELIPADLL